MYKLVCTSYNKVGSSLVLRNNWIEDIKDDKHLVDYLETHNIRMDFRYLGKGEISKILVGTMDLPSVDLHIRILRIK